MIRPLLAALLLVVSAPAFAEELTEQQLHVQDQRLAAIADRIMAANAALCTQTMPITGLTLHSADQYSEGYARSLDHSVASISALPAIVEAVGGKLAVMLDSGVRRGSDVVKALALGADMVLVGRAPLYGMAAFGEPGAARAISLLAEEIARTMAMLGLTDIAQIDRAALA